MIALFIMGSSSIKNWERKLDHAVTELNRSQKRGIASIDVLDQTVPSLSRQLRRCTTSQPIQDLWALSSNHDELAKAEIVSRPILRAIAKLTGCPLDDGSFHAGFLHTYGYLLSVLETPFGLKRNRWIRPTIDHAFGFPHPTVRVHPRCGALLENLTWFLGSIAFDPDSAERSQLRELKGRISPNLAGRKWRPKIRIIERTAKTGLEILTDLVPLPNPQGELTTLLVYSLRDAQSRHRLVTMFPITGAFEAELTDPSRFGRKTDLALRYNAVYPEHTGKPLTGTRTLLQN